LIELYCANVTNVPLHTPVLLSEVMSVLRVQPGDICLDATIGAGGHARAILSQLGPEGRLIGVDRDRDVLEETSRGFENEHRAKLFWTTFDNVQEVLKEAAVQKVDVILCDLGVSSPQLDCPDRGFSFQTEGPLDMRMDRSLPVSAADLIARSSEKDLAAVFADYGEERHARRIARAIVRRRRADPIVTTTALADLVAGAVPGRGRIHPATRVFQALRIAVNDEFRQLESFLVVAPDALRVGGRLAVIAFHSLEDRLVKHAFRDAAAGHSFEILTRKPIVASRAETLANRRARSAKLRGLRRVA